MGADVVDVVPFHFSDDVQVSASVKIIRCSSISWRGVTRLAVRDLLEDRIDVVTAQRIGADGLDVAEIHARENLSAGPYGAP